MIQTVSLGRIKLIFLPSCAFCSRRFIRPFFSTVIQCYTPTIWAASLWGSGLKRRKRNSICSHPEEQETILISTAGHEGAPCRWNPMNGGASLNSWTQCACLSTPDPGWTGREQNMHYREKKLQKDHDEADQLIRFS